MTKPVLLCGVAFAAGCLLAFAAGSSLGDFEGSNDVGELLHPGSADYDASSKTYSLTGSGEDMLSARDDFQFLWKKVSAENVSLATDIALPGSGGDNHRKAVLMIRQSLDTDAAYVGVCAHNKDLTQKAVFTNLDLSLNPKAGPRKR